MPKITARFTWLLGARGLSLLASAIGLLILPNLLGVGQFSKYTYYTALIGIIFQFTGFGVEQAIQRFILQLRNQGKQGLIKQVIVLAGIVEVISLFGAGIVLFSLFLINPQITDSSILLLILVGIMILSKTASQFLYQTDLGFERFKLAFLNSGPSEILSLIGVIVGYILGGFEGLLMGMSLSMVVISLVNLIKVIDTLKKESILSANPSHQRFSIKKMLLFGFPIYLGNNLAKIAPPVGTFLLAVYLGKENPTVGYFTIGVSIITALSYVIGTLLTSAFPNLVRAKDTHNHKEFSKLLSKEVKYSLLFAILTYSALLSFSQLIFKLLLPNYEAALIFVYLLGSVLIVYAFEKPYLQVAQTHHITKLLLERGVLYFVLYISLYPILISRYEGMGASVAFLLVSLGIGIYTLIRTEQKAKVGLQIKELFLVLPGLILFLPAILPHSEISYLLLLPFWGILTWKLLDDYDKKLVRELLLPLKIKAF